MGLGVWSEPHGKASGVSYRYQKASLRPHLDNLSGQPPGPSLCQLSQQSDPWQHTPGALPQCTSIPSFQWLHLLSQPHLVCGPVFCHPLSGSQFLQQLHLTLPPEPCPNGLGAWLLLHPQPTCLALCTSLTQRTLCHLYTLPRLARNPIITFFFCSNAHSDIQPLPYRVPNTLLADFYKVTSFYYLFIL